MFILGAVSVHRVSCGLTWRGNCNLLGISENVIMFIWYLNKYSISYCDLFNTVPLLFFLCNLI